MGRHASKSVFGSLLHLAGVAIVAAGAATQAWQAMHLLQHGTWVSLELGLLWDWIGGAPLSSRWAGGNHGLGRWVMGWPLGAGLVSAGAAAIWMGWLGEEMRR